MNHHAMKEAVPRAMEVFFDYACPYCYEAHKHLAALTGKYPKVAIQWRPCEAHPRPERYGPHSDLCIRGMFFARDNGADIWAYHDLMYRAALVNRVQIEDAAVLSKAVDGLLDAEVFHASLRRGDYQDALAWANGHAYEHSGVWAVPAYRAGGRRLDAIEDIGVTRAQLEAFLQAIR